MPILVSAFEISKSFGSKTLFEGLSFGIESNQKIGLIGPNGAGKSTLLKIITRLEKPDTGKITFSNGLRLGYLTQNPTFKNDETVFNTILEASPNHETYENLDLVNELISKLNLDSPEAGSDRLVNDLSGGWKKKVALARELARKPNLLLLDEPTNHLDLQSIFWLEEYLQRQTELAVLIVTHDRLFLQNTCDHIFDLDKKNPNNLISYQGAYSEFVEFKTSLLNAQKGLEEKRKNLLRRETEWLRRGAKARQTKQKARIDRAGDLKDEVSTLTEKNRDLRLNMQFGDFEKSPKKLIEADEIAKTLGGKSLFNNFSFILGPNSRLGILGKNGCGKSTLIKTLLGILPPDSGKVKIADGTRFAYFEQQKESLNPKHSLLKSICPEGDYVHLQGQPVYAKSYLARFHFRPEQHDLPVEKLSGGEQSRLLIAKLMLQNEPILVLDEPTNDLDIATLDTLQEALKSFPGAVILVTHDRYFMDQVVNQIVAFSDDTDELTKFADYLQWQQWYSNKPTTQKKKQIAAEEVKASAPKKLSYKEQLELEGIEKKIAATEALLEQYQSELSSVVHDFQKLQIVTDKLEKQKSEVDFLYQRWEYLTQSRT